MIYVDKILHNRESSDVLLPGISTKKSSGKIAMMVCDGFHGKMKFMSDTRFAYFFYK